MSRGGLWAICRSTNFLALIICLLIGVIFLLLNEDCVPLNPNIVRNNGLGTDSSFHPVDPDDASGQVQGRRDDAKSIRNQDEFPPQPPSNNKGDRVGLHSEALIKVYDKSNQEYTYDANSPLIWIGGMPRSGTTLMRAMLDAHPEVRCGEETRVIPRILGMRSNWRKNKKESKRLEEAGINSFVLDSAVRAFMLEIITKHGPPAPRLCNKDPFTLKSAEYLSKLFPKSKFILMIRDGRATVHSIISRKITITGFDLTNYRQCLEKWNTAITTMYQQCYDVGPDRCFPMYYEQLVLHPEAQLRELINFLDLPWNSSVLNHHQYIGKEISISKVERSSDQIIKPVNTDALAKWVPHIPDDVKADMADIAPMLKQLGYDPNANPPNYGKADTWVRKNTYEIHKNEGLYDEKASKLGIARVTERPLPKDFQKQENSQNSDRRRNQQRRNQRRR